MKVKFGIQVQQEALSFEEFRRYFLKCENLGFYSAFTNDHFHPVFTPLKSSYLENWVLLSAIAVETSKIRIGTQVICNNFRYPSLLAKMTASLDVISNGRLEFMIGAGWYEREYLGYGIPFPPYKIRIEQMREAVEIVKRMWTEHKTCFKGKHYQLEGALNYPKPVQKPYPKIWVGGVGKATLKSVTEIGDGTNLMGSPESIEKKLRLLKKICEEVSRDYNSIEKSWSGDLVIGLSKGEIERKLKNLGFKFVVQDANRGSTKKERSLSELEGPSLVGDPSQVIDKIEEYVRKGIDYFIIVPSDFRDIKDIELFKQKVMTSFS